MQTPVVVGNVRRRSRQTTTMLRLRTLASGRLSLHRTLTSSSSLSASSSSSEKSVPVPPVPQTNPSSVDTVPQAPNYATRWSTNQNLRPAPASNPRFEQVDYELQPAPLSAMEMIANEPIIMSDARIAVCDGGMSVSFFLFVMFCGVCLRTLLSRWWPTGTPKDFHQFGMSLLYSATYYC